VVENNPATTASIDIEPDAKRQSSTFLRGVIVLAFVIGLGHRMIGLHYPPYDNHSFRQCQTLSTIEDFYRNGVDFLHPRTLYMGYPGVMVLELPLFQAIGAAIYNCFGPHLELIRILNILFGTLTTIVLYRTLLLWFDQTLATLTVIIYWLAPLNIIYHRSTLLDPMAVFFALLSFYCLAVLLANMENSANLTGSLYPKEAIATHSHPGHYYCVFAFATLVTILIKALYLWPSVLLFGQTLLTKKFKIDRPLLRMLIVFAAAGVCFIGWNRYAAQVNATNSLASGLKPTSLLGFSSLLERGFYSTMLKERSRQWLGLLGAILYPFGLWAWWSGRRTATWRSKLFLALFIPPSYLLAFPQINHPHNYYQLIVAPFLAVASANGVVWLAKKFQHSSLGFSVLKKNVLTVAVSVWVIAAVANYVLWYKWPRIDRRTLEFEKLCAGNVEPWAPTILFATAEVTVMDRSNIFQIPQFLYAGKLWGYGCTVPDVASAREIFEVARKGFQRLDYIVFYGTEFPKWMPNEDFLIVKQDNIHRLFVFKSKDRIRATAAP